MPTSKRKKRALNKIYYQLHQKKLSLQARKNYARKSDEIWKACPLALRQLANGKVQKEEEEIIRCTFVHTHAHSYDVEFEFACLSG